MRVTTKGQVTIPARVRDYLGIAPHGIVDFRITEGSVVLVRRTAEGGGRGRCAELRGVLRGRWTTRRWMRATRGN